MGTICRSTKILVNHYFKGLKHFYLLPSTFQLPRLIPWFQTTVTHYLLVTNRCNVINITCLYTRLRFVIKMYLLHLAQVALLPFEIISWRQICSACSWHIWLSDSSASGTKSSHTLCMFFLGIRSHSTEWVLAYCYVDWYLTKPFVIYDREKVLGYLSSQLQTVIREGDTPRTDAENRHLCDQALKGLKLLSSWTQRVVELVRYIFLSGW
jgi:hypothetical protein